MKEIISTDWHIGNKNNSIIHNQDLLEFVKFMIDYSIANNIKKFTHLGDFFHQRNKLDISSLNYSIKISNMLLDHFGKYNQIKGNHDLYLRDSREISSLEIFRGRVNLVDYYQIEGDKMYVSWLVSGEEYDEIIKISKKNKIRFMFGHFEFSNFKLNENYLMEHGQSHKELRHIEKIYTGHYHMKQQKDNVQYVGTPFQFDYNDANDFDRGFTVFDSNTGESEFIKYNKINILSLDYKDVLSNNFDDIDNPSLRVIINEDVTDDILEQLKEKLSSSVFRDTKILYNFSKEDSLLSDNVQIGEITNIDDAVIKYLSDMCDIPGVNKSLLTKMYQEEIQND
jgi:DNA repair exonuclease SbcCD nuclease subunit